MKNLLLLKKISCSLILFVVIYHIIFGTARFLIDFKCPNGWIDGTVTVFGEELRVSVFSSLQEKNIWKLGDTQPERQENPQYGTIGTLLDNNVYDYETEMGWFYQYKTFYAYGRNGFWIIQNNPFHIKLLRSPNIPAKDAQKLDEVIAGYNIYGNQFTVVNSELDLTQEEQNAYVRVKEKAQPRIEKLKAEGLFP